PSRGCRRMPGGVIRPGSLTWAPGDTARWPAGRSAGRSGGTTAAAVNKAVGGHRVEVRRSRGGSGHVQFHPWPSGQVWTLIGPQCLCQHRVLEGESRDTRNTIYTGAAVKSEAKGIHHETKTSEESFKGSGLGHHA